MPKAVKFVVEGSYNGHNIKANKSIDISFKFSYGELINVVKLLQLLNENVLIGVKVGAKAKPKALGTFMIKDLKIDGDGESTVKFNSLLDHVEAENLNDLAGENLFIMFKATVEDDGE